MKKYFILFAVLVVLAGTAFFYYHKYTVVAAEFNQYKTEQELAQAEADKAALQKQAALKDDLDKLTGDLQNALSDNSSLNNKLSGMRNDNASYKAKLNILLNTSIAEGTAGKSETRLLREFVQQSIPDAERANGYAIELNDMRDRYALLEKYARVCAGK